MATATVSYGTKTTITISLASLAASSGLTAGQESTEVDNTSNKFVDVLVQGKFKTGSASVAVGTGAVYVWGSDTAASTTNLDVLDGTDSAETMTSSGVRDGLLRLGAAIAIEAANNRTYNVAPFSIASLFGGVVPKYWGLWFSHSSTAALSSTAGDHEFTYTGIKFDIA